MTTSAENRQIAFISHASADSTVANIYVSVLESKGIECWIAPRNLTAGKEYAQEIIKGIEKANLVILLLSEAANLSAHVRRELERAASKDKPIYPVRIEEVNASPKLEYFVSMHHWLDAWEGSVEDHAIRLVNAISSEEEWTKNVLLRRRWINRGIISTALLFLILSSLLFLPDVRQTSQEKRSGTTLQKLANLECGRLKKELLKMRMTGICKINIYTLPSISTAFYDALVSNKEFLFANEGAGRS